MILRVFRKLLRAMLFQKCAFRTMILRAGGLQAPRGGLEFARAPQNPGILFEFAAKKTLQKKKIAMSKHKKNNVSGKGRCACGGNHEGPAWRGGSEGDMGAGTKAG